MKKLRLLWIVALASLMLSASAQNADNKWALYGSFTRAIYAGDLGDTFFNFNEFGNWGAGIGLNRYLSRFFDVGIYGTWNSHYGGSKYGPDMIPTYGEWINSPSRNLNFPNDDGSRDREATNFSADNIFNGRAQLNFKFLGKDNAWIHPYLILSWGFVAYDNLKTQMIPDAFGNPETGIIKYHQVIWSDEHRSMWPTPEGAQITGGDNPAFAMTVGSGMGFDIRLSCKFSLRYQFDVMWTDHENRDFVLSGKSNRDAFDNDWQFQHSLGLVWSFGGTGCKREKVEKPVVVPTIVEQVLCDGDGDGVPDNLDKCPNTPVCARPVDADGCPSDEDGDGVYDGCDRCPGTPAGVKVDSSGCPIDTDGDGIPDYLDKCPLERGPKSNDGCPVETAKAIQPYVVHFATNLYNLDATAVGILDDAVAMLKANPDVRVDITGHTDSRGTLEFNRALANSRANAVKQYLVKKGIDVKRINSVEGFWYSKPVADNTTVSGLAANRRAEVIPINVQ